MSRVAFRACVRKPASSCVGEADPSGGSCLPRRKDQTVSPDERDTANVVVIDVIGIVSSPLFRAFMERRTVLPSHRSRNGTEGRMSHFFMIRSRHGDDYHPALPRGSRAGGDEVPGLHLALPFDGDRPPRPALELVLHQLVRRARDLDLARLAV